MTKSFSEEHGDNGLWIYYREFLTDPDGWRKALNSLDCEVIAHIGKSSNPDGGIGPVIPQSMLAVAVKDRWENSDGWEEIPPKGTLS